MLLALDAVHSLRANLTSWRHHRRQKRFLIFQDGGVIKVLNIKYLYIIKYLLIDLYV